MLFHGNRRHLQRGEPWQRSSFWRSTPDFQLTIIDTKCASMGFGLVVYKCLRMQENGAPKDLIIEAAQYFCSHMEHIVTVETLEYLYRGGRLSKTSAVLGGVLDIKPIIEIDKDGALVATEKVRGPPEIPEAHRGYRLRARCGAG